MDRGVRQVGGTCRTWIVGVRQGRLDDCTPLEEEDAEPNELDPEDHDPRGRWIECTISSELEEKLEVAHELACRLEGRNLSKADAIDRMIAEYMAGEGGAVLSEIPEPSDEEKEKERDCLDVVVHKRLYNELEFVDLGQYATERLGISQSQAYGLAALGRKLQSFPKVRAALKTGQLTRTHARAIADLERVTILESSSIAGYYTRRFEYT